MPRVISFTPAWLSRPCPGFQVFDPSKAGRLNGTQLSRDEFIGPNRTLARRGAEVFIVVGNQIRWADLSLLKDRWEQVQATPSKVPKSTEDGRIQDVEDSGPDDGSYRVCLSLQVSLSDLFG